MAADLLDRGFDVTTRAALARLPWRTARTAILGLLSADTRLARALTPDRPAKGMRG